MLKKILLPCTAAALALTLASCRSTNKEASKEAPAKLTMDLLGSRGGTVPPPYSSSQEAQRAATTGRPAATPQGQLPEGQPSLDTAIKEAPTFQAVTPAPKPAKKAAAQKKAKEEKVIHVVEKGENLSAIAQRYHVSKDAIRAANNIKNENKIFVGQKLTIPGADDSAAPAKKASKKAAPKKVTVVNGVYTVQPGDNLSKIAKKLKVSISNLKAWNPDLKEPYRLQVNQKLNVSEQALQNAAKTSAAPAPKKDDTLPPLPPATKDDTLPVPDTAAPVPPAPATDAATPAPVPPAPATDAATPAPAAPAAPAVPAATDTTVPPPPPAAPLD